MRVCLLVVGVVSALAAATPARAQEPESWSPAEVAAACAPIASPTHAAHALRVVGTQDTIPKTVIGSADLLIVNGGTEAGVQLDARFFLRRRSTTVQTFGMAQNADVITDGWIRIVSANESTSIGRVERLCGPIYVDDYLEPFARPQMPAAADTPIDADFSSLGRVITGADGHTLTGINEIAVIDRGSEQGVQPGARFAVYRDLTTGVNPLMAAPPGTPLTAIGEAVVISTTGDRSVARIVRARDAVRTGDYVAPAK